ncbi:MAG: hypothetical protein EKK64_00550 [Neisseriaceae bacterium]|nr:MAG: hypothetical protein EKK64_00550 [Neisseriaceae bacterium]
MKNNLLLIFSTIVILSGMFFFYSSYKKDIEILREENNAYMVLLEKNNYTLSHILDEQVRISHYISGHRIQKKYHLGCIECKILGSMFKRKIEIDKEIGEIELFIDKNPNDPKVKEKIAKVKSLSDEYNMLEQRLYYSDIQSQKIKEEMN